mgnify:FL=1
MARLSNTQTLPFIGTGATVTEAAEAAGVQYEAFKSENPNKGFLGYATSNFVQDVDSVPTHHFVIWATVTKNDLPD